MNYECRPISWIVEPSGEPLFSEMGTTVTIVDEASGEFVEVSQHGHPDLGKIQINPDEWPSLQAAIDYAISLCKRQEIDTE